MKNNRAVIVWKILFAVILVLTVALWCILMTGAVQYADQIDDKLGTHLAVPIGLVLLVIVLIQELVIYKGVKYFLQGNDSRTWPKTVFYITLLALDFMIVLWEAIYLVFPHIFHYAIPR